MQTEEAVETPAPLDIHLSLWQGGLQNAAAVVWNQSSKAVTQAST